MTRREALVRTAAATLAATGMATPGVVFAADYSQTPGVTEGPYWVDAGLNRSDLRSNVVNGVSGATIAGLPLNLAVNVSKLTNNKLVPVNGAKVDIWQTNALGVYSAIQSEGTTGQNYLRGYQLTNAHGNVKLVAVYPGWYSGRTVHTHFRVRLYSGTTVAYNFVSQMFYNDTTTTQVFAASAPYNTRGTRTTTNATDGIYHGGSQGVGGSVASEAGSYLLLRLAANTTRATASFTVVL